MTAKKIWQDSDKLVVVIRELGKHGNVTQAIKTAKAARGWVYGRRQRDRFFRDAFEASRACGIEVLKDEAHRRACKGIEEPVFHQGEICGHVRKYSDALLMFLIKQADPSYREHHKIDHGNADKRPFLFKIMLHPDAVKATQQTPEPEQGDQHAHRFQMKLYPDAVRVVRANSNQQRINDDQE